MFCLILLQPDFVLQPRQHKCHAPASPGLDVEPLGACFRVFSDWISNVTRTPSLLSKLGTRTLKLVIGAFRVIPNLDTISRLALPNAWPLQALRRGNVCPRFLCVLEGLNEALVMRVQKVSFGITDRTFWLQRWVLLQLPRIRWHRSLGDLCYLCKLGLFLHSPSASPFCLAWRLAKSFSSNLLGAEPRDDLCPYDWFFRSSNLF
mmetsp:Transcript_10995/g.19585  ORF Transcript_10995/g.19585 Transcript_10995/m.19585 type:complete len:205 (-) Transcript_10995:3671-4285(-)